jgi:prephenate dehydrogenase
MSKTIVIVGLGLIGGSLAKALKLYTDHQILGMDANEESLLDACSCGAVDGKATRSQIAQADMIYLCIYPKDAVKFVAEYGPHLKQDCIVTDTCGIKKYVCKEICKLAEGMPYHFVAGHPMAGKESSGFASSDPSIFVGASYLIAPCGAPEWAVQEVANLAKTMEFGSIVLTTPEQHDRVIAYTSQLPHVLACAYVMSPRCKEHKGFSAGSYRDVSRVANINSDLWTGLFLENQEDLTKEIDTLIEHLSAFRSAVFQADRQTLHDLLDQAGTIKRQEG